MFNYINSIKCKEINSIGICVVCFLNMWTFNVSLSIFAFLIPIIFQSWGFVVSGNRFLWINEASYISKVYQILTSNYYISITLSSFYVVKFKSGEIINPEFLFLFVHDIMIFTVSFKILIKRIMFLVQFHSFYIYVNRNHLRWLVLA